jgi:hypothetical protein
MCLAKTALTMSDLASPETEITSRGAVFQFFLQTGFDELVLFRHGVSPVG